MNTQPILDVALATWRPDGILRVAEMNLPEVPGVRYIVSWQLPGDNPQIPPSLSARTDVRVCILHRPGVSVNRNNALANCSAPLVLMGDDDLVYTRERLLAIIDTFQKNPDVDVATFRYDGYPKFYPDVECNLGKRLPKGYNVALIEIAVRRKSLGDIRFDERFGPGAPDLHAAEDQKFLFDCRHAGLECRFFPVTICTHDHASTGERSLTPGIAAAEGALIRLEYPGTWFLRIPLKTWRTRQRHHNILKTLTSMFRGAGIVTRASTDTSDRLSRCRRRNSSDAKAPH